jgi:hypothetical protein
VSQRDVLFILQQALNNQTKDSKWPENVLNAAIEIATIAI